MGKLLKVAGALPFLMAIFLNTVVDLGHKIVIQNTIFKIYDGSEQVYLTAIVNGLILLPFILMFSTAGFMNIKRYGSLFNNAQLDKALEAISETYEEIIDEVTL